MGIISINLKPDNTSTTNISTTAAVEIVDDSMQIIEKENCEINFNGALDNSLNINHIVSNGVLKNIIINNISQTKTLTVIGAIMIKDRVILSCIMPPNSSLTLKRYEQSYTFNSIATIKIINEYVDSTKNCSFDVLGEVQDPSITIQIGA